MYYSELAKIKAVEKMLERLAYASVWFDVLAAIATFLVMRAPAKAFGSLLIVSDYLIFIEVIVAAIIVIMLMVMKYYSKVTERLSVVMFKMKHAR
ncbi:MAG: hypothetical protein ACP5UH_00760 [Candidatus Micrarchaeia archaeon]